MSRLEEILIWSGVAVFVFGGGLMLSAKLWPEQKKQQERKPWAKL